jgi:RimJ/RimL family protein N-acetyltransferase
MTDAAPVVVRAFTFETRRLRINLLSTADENLFCDLYTNPETMRFIGPPLAPDRALRAFRSAVAVPSPDKQVLLAVAEKAGGTAVGICSIQGLDERRRRVETGIILRQHVGARGYAHEAMRGLIAHVFGILPVEEVWVRISVDHAVARRVAAGIGLVRSGDVSTQSKTLLWSAYRKSWNHSN